MSQETKSPSKQPDYVAKYMRERRVNRQEQAAGRPAPRCCEICGGPPRGRWRRLNFDHQHNTDNFRGWLCNLCNQALGLAGDNPAILRRMADYLTEHGHTPTRPVIR